MTESNLTTIEHDIAELEKRLQEKKAALEQEKSTGSGSPTENHPSEKEMLHEIVGEKIQQHVPAYQPQQPTVQAPSPVIAEPPSYLSQELKDKIQEIIRLVFAKNLEEGIREAAKTGNMAVIDAFHDILVDELYDQLIEKRKLDRVEWYEYSSW